MFETSAPDQKIAKLRWRIAAIAAPRAGRDAATEAIRAIYEPGDRSPKRFVSRSGRHQVAAVAADRSERFQRIVDVLDRDDLEAAVARGSASVVGLGGGHQEHLDAGPLDREHLLLDATD